jgi:hypothetical protein
MLAGSRTRSSSRDIPEQQDLGIALAGDAKLASSIERRPAVYSAILIKVSSVGC